MTTCINNKCTCAFETRRPEMDDFERKKNFGGKGKIRRQEL